LLTRVPVELATHVLVVTGLLALYPLRLLYYSRSREPPSNRLLRQRIRIPASFDPAPILYPAILPVLVSISLYTSFDKGLVPNLMLSLAALPPQLVPYGASRVGFSDVHWLLSALPLAVAENTDLLANMLALKPYKLKLPAPEQGLHPEIVVSLFALHQALLPPLHYLTTTSLLPAELHLLSIGLINLLLFADSPQAGILRTLLWLGGLGIFVLCAQVLKWGVALARIPRWRFRRAGHSIAKRQSILQLLNGSFKRRSRSTGRNISDSDADEDDVLFNNTLTKTRSLKLNTGNILPEDSFIVDEPKTLDALHLPKRRNTLPSIPWRGNTRHARRDRSKSIAGSFLSLTPLQASMRRWLYAGYFYIIVILTVVGPIRHVISKYSLHHHEPFGWAVGYLFGNNQRLRFEVFNWDLEGWIALPPLVDRDSSPSLSTLGIAEYLRHVVIGEANTRLLLCIWCAGIVAVGLIVVLGLSSIVEVDTRRKVFHGTMVAMLLPTIYIDPSFVSLALSLVLAIFLLLDLIRASQLPPLSTPIAKFLTPYVDGRDLRGPVVISHIFLLVGCAIPLWLSLASVERTGDEPWRGWDVQDRDVSMIAGVICVGMGDAAASLIGRRYGRRKWPWAGGKSFEGSAAFAMAVTVGLVFGNAWLEVGGWGNRSHGDKSGTAILSHWVVVVAKAVVCAMGASLEEAVLTGGNDNVIVPVVLWVLVRGVGL
jgi:dolichol kinase